MSRVILKKLKIGDHVLLTYLGKDYDESIQNSTVIGTINNIDSTMINIMCISDNCSDEELRYPVGKSFSNEKSIFIKSKDNNEYVKIKIL